MPSLAQRAKNLLETLSTVMVIVAALALLWAMFVRQQPAAANAPPPPVQDATGVIAGDHLSKRIGTGPIAIIEFMDFQCPFCAKHAQETLPTLKKELIDTGKVRYISIDMPLPIHTHAKRAAEAAECAAEQGKYWNMHDALLVRQQEFAGVSEASFASHIDGLDLARFDECLRTDRMLVRVKADQNEAKRLGVRATPTLFIGRMRTDGGVDLLRQIGGAQPAEVFVKEVLRLAKE